jgi:hypothetical protein
MRQRPQTRPRMFAFAAAAVTITAGLIVAGAAHDGPGRRSPRTVVAEHIAGVVATPTARPARPQPGLPVSSGRATRIARRFAASWRAWDTGYRLPRDAATLRRLSVAALWQRLRREQPRPTAARPPTSIALHPVDAIATGRGSWRAALIAAHPHNSYLGTLVIVATSAGPRVAQIQR